MIDSPLLSGGCDVRVLFVSDTHIGLDWPTRPRVVRPRRGDDFFQNFERALEPARAGDVDVVVHGGDLLYRSRVPAWVAETALAPLKRIASSGISVLHQVLRPAGRPPVIYAGSVERTSFAEAPETKGCEFRPLPARPMVSRIVQVDDADPMEAHARVAAAIESTPHDAVVHLRVAGAMPATLTAAALRAMAGVRTVTRGVRRRPTSSGRSKPSTHLTVLSILAKIDA